MDSKVKSETEANVVRTGCDADCHMTPAEYMVYDTMRRFSRRSGVFYMDGRNLADRYREDVMSKSTVYRQRKLLEEEGWVIKINPPVQSTRGSYASMHYTVLRHDEWANAHPGQCRTFNRVGRLLDADSASSFPQVGTTSPADVNGHSNGRELDVPPMGTDCPTGGNKDERSKPKKAKGKRARRKHQQQTVIRFADRKNCCCDC